MSRRATLPVLCAAALMLAGAPGVARVGVIVGIAPPAPVVETVPAPPGSRVTGAGTASSASGCQVHTSRRGPLRSRGMGPRSLDQAWPRLGVGRWALAALAAVRLDGATPRTRQARKNPQRLIEI
jgi:hypothetical protein